MARPRSIPVRQALVNLFPAQVLRDLARRSGAVVRQRKVDPAALFWSVVLGFGVERQRTIAALRRAYERATGQSIEESSFYDRRTAPFARMLRLAFARALEIEAARNRRLEGALAAFRDVVMTDATVVRLHDLLAKTFAGCRTNHSKAALKLHAIFSVRTAGCRSVKITSERRHDDPVLRVGPWVEGTLFLFDLAYFRYQLFACIDQNGGYFLPRLKGLANPVIIKSNRRHRGRARKVVGERLRDVAEGMRRGFLDMLVEVTFPRRRYAGRVHRDRQVLRVIAVREEGRAHYHFYVTNAPPEKLRAEDVVKIYAALLALVVSRALLEVVAHKLGPEARHRLPEQRWSRIFANTARDVLVLILSPPRHTRLVARQLAALLLAEALDPNTDHPPLLRAVETRRHQYRIRPRQNAEKSHDAVR